MYQIGDVYARSWIVAGTSFGRSTPKILASETSFVASRQRHARIAKSAAEIIEFSLDGSVSIASIAQSLGVSERTLLSAFRSQFDMTPRRFIQSMRLNHSRARLREANNPETLVQDCAAECGFWDFGRSAAKYQRLFGEYPAATLKNGRPGR